MSKTHPLQETAPAVTTRAPSAIEPRTLSPAKAARYLGIGKTKMWALLMAGRIPSKKLDGRTLVLTSDLDAFLDELPRAVAS
jgi:excisionase family DNA binding protein